jgi:pyridoxal biosynthesis lyase PdxS
MWKRPHKDVRRLLSGRELEVLIECSSSVLKRKRSRQLHYGVMQLCEVIHRRVVAGKQLLLTKNNAKFGKVGPAAEALELIAQDLKQAASIITTPRDQDIKMMNDHLPPPVITI